MGAKRVTVESIGSFFESLTDPRHTQNRKHPFLDKFGITLSNGAFSTIKSKIKNSGNAPAKKPGRPAASTNGATSQR